MFLSSLADTSEVFSFFSVSDKLSSLSDFSNISASCCSCWVASQSIFSDLILSGVIGVFFLSFIMVGCQSLIWIFIYFLIFINS